MFFLEIFTMGIVYATISTSVAYIMKNYYENTVNSSSPESPEELEEEELTEFAELVNLEIVDTIRME